MAPRTGADGLLRPIGKIASTGLGPVLAIAFLLTLAGCGGGGGSAQTETGTTAAASQQAEASKGSGAGSERHGGEGKARAREESKAAARPSPEGGKQGPSIVPPQGPREPEPNAAERAEASLADIALSSPALEPGTESTIPLPALFTCKGKNVAPPLRWSGVPAGTAELVLFALNLEPVSEALFFDWALAGLDPALTSLAQGQQAPKGAVTGRNSFGKLGYSVCPGHPETVIFALYALPKRLGASRGFDPAALRKEVLDASGNVGLLATSYQGD